MPNAGTCCVYVGTAARPPVCVTCVSLNLTILACLCASKRDPRLLAEAEREPAAAMGPVPAAR